MKPKHWIPFLLTLAYLGSFPVQSYAVDPDPEVTSTAFAELIDVLSATEATPLNFGRFFIDGEGGGSIVIAPTSGIDRTSTGNAIQLAAGGSPSPAIYEVVGYPDCSVSITLPGPAILTNTSNSAHQMIVNNWVSMPSNSAKLDMNGKLTFYVGAVLNVESLSQNPVGVYTGTYTITFTYN
jgi:hypothetical protein